MKGAVNTVAATKLKTSDVPVNYSKMPQPIIKLNMPLELHGNSDFKTGAGSEFSSKNVGVLDKKLKLI